MAAVVTFKGLEILWDRVHGVGTPGTEPLDLAWGNNPNTLTAAKSDVNLFKEAAESRVGGTATIVTTTTTNDTYQVTGTFTSLTGQTIAEVALGDTSSKPQVTTVTGGTAVGSNSGTNLTVTSATGFPGSGNYDIQIRTEVLTVTAGQGTTSWTVTRGANGSTAISTIANADVVTGGNAPGQTAVTNGDLFVHADHGAQTLATNDQIAYTIKVTAS
jgi:hypothetical protein